MPSTLNRRSLLRTAGLLGVGSVVGASVIGCSDEQAAVGPVRTVSHRHGVTEVSGTPSRIVTVGLTEQDYVLALGVVPVGVRDWFGEQPGALWPWAATAANRIGGATPEVLPIDALPFERIAALNPDLILGLNAAVTRAEYDTLSGIAPTVAQPAEFADYGAPWQRIAEIAGLAMNRSAQVGELVAGVDARFTQVRDANPGFAGRTALLAAILGDGSYYVYAEGPAPRLLVDLVFALPPAAAALFTDENRAPVQLSREQLSVLDADVLVIGLYGDQARELAETDPVLTNLRVAREGRIVALPELSLANGSMSFGSVLSLPAALDELTPRIVAALDGDPTTAVDPA